MTPYTVTYIAVRGIEHDELTEYATSMDFTELPHRHDHVWLGEQRYAVRLRELNRIDAHATLYVEPVGAPRVTPTSDERTAR
jgi:hypothetical protein